MAETEFDIVIVGAGIAGATLANLLSDTNLRIALVDAGQVPIAEPITASTSSEIDPRVLALTEASKSAFEAAGVWPEIEAKGVSPYQKMAVWDAEGTGKVNFDSADISTDALGHIIENRSAVWALQAKLRHTSVTIFSEQRLKDIRHQDKSVSLHFESGQQLSAQLLVGADGANSMVREAMGRECHSIDNHQKAIVCHIETQQSHDKIARQRFLTTGPLALLPIAAVADNVSSIVWSCDNEYAETILSLDDETFCEHLSVASERVLGGVVNATPRLAFPLVAQHAASYTAKNTLLVGDAAHVVHPLAGQGINLGLSDVVCLAKLVKKAAANAVDVNNTRLLAAYRRHRRGDNFRMIALTQTFRHLFASDALPVRWLRNQGMNTVDGQPALKRAIIKQAMGV